MEQLRQHGLRIQSYLKRKLFSARALMTGTILMAREEHCQASSVPRLSASGQDREARPAPQRPSRRWGYLRGASCVLSGQGEAGLRT